MYLQLKLCLDMFQFRQKIKHKKIKHLLLIGGTMCKSVKCIRLQQSIKRAIKIEYYYF
jgi:hypothetical protein